MWISKKEYKALIKRIEKLESENVVDSYEYGSLTLKTLVRKLPDIISATRSKRAAE